MTSAKVPTLQSQNGAPSGKNPGAIRKIITFPTTSRTPAARVIAISGTKVSFAFVIFSPISRMEKLVVFRIIKNMMMEMPSMTKLITCPGSSTFRWRNRLQRNRYVHTQIISTENTAEASLRCLLSFATSVTSEKLPQSLSFFTILSIQERGSKAE